MSPFIIDNYNSRRSRMARARSFVATPAKIQDIRRLVDIEFSAFEYEQVNQVLSFRDYKKPAHFERSVEIYRRALNAETTTSERTSLRLENQEDSTIAHLSPIPRVEFKKVVDTESGEIVSFSKIERKAYAPQELRTPLDIGHEEEPMMNRDWFALNERLRREYVGLEEHIYIGMLATEPRHQHRGAGTMLLEEILAEADDAGVEVYLEATDTAKPLYEKHGFEAITELRFDPAQYGLKGLGIERQTVMVRGAQGSDGARIPVKSCEAAVTSTKTPQRKIGERSVCS